MLENDMLKSKTPKSLFTWGEIAGEVAYIQRAAGNRIRTLNGQLNHHAVGQ